jgi:hypothetical protein
MIELICKNQNSQFGLVQVVLRFVGQDIFIKSNINAQAKTLIEQFRTRGAEVEWNSDFTWCRVNLFKINPVIKLGSIELDEEENTPQEIEKGLADFYESKYQEAHFEVIRNG